VKVIGPDKFQVKREQISEIIFLIKPAVSRARQALLSLELIKLSSACLLTAGLIKNNLTNLFSFH